MAKRRVTLTAIVLARMLARSVRPRAAPVVVGGSPTATIRLWERSDLQRLKLNRGVFGEGWLPENMRRFALNEPRPTNMTVFLIGR